MSLGKGALSRWKESIVATGECQASTQAKAHAQAGAGAAAAGAAVRAEAHHDRRAAHAVLACAARRVPHAAQVPGVPRHACTDLNA